LRKWGTVEEDDSQVDLEACQWDRS
jgi:hypothetical protein